MARLFADAVEGIFTLGQKNRVLLCQTLILTGNNSGCYDKKLREDDLIALIENAIKCVLQSNKEKTANLRDEANASAKELNLVKKGLQTEVGSLDRIRRNKEKLFQKLMDNQVTDDEYMRLSEELELEQIKT